VNLSSHQHCYGLSHRWGRGPVADGICSVSHPIAMVCFLETLHVPERLVPGLMKIAIYFSEKLILFLFRL
jgi:hypothetical protein